MVNPPNRILQLELLIPETMSLLARTPRKDAEEYARTELLLHHYRLEYRERTGKEYQHPRVDRIVREHG